jgi:DNA-binding Lrp family transcriptional regulator
MLTSDSVSEPVDRDSAGELAMLDRKIILATQAGLPVHERPFDLIASEVESDPKIVKQRFNAMLEDGRIRRIGLVPNHYRLGYVANGIYMLEM